jgi:hypothetical protein
VAKKAAPVSLTGGPGFQFEDGVAARFLADMLGGFASFGSSFGHVVAINWQVRDTGRLLDDLAVTFDAADGSHTAEISIKSHRQVMASGFPQNFVEAAWEEWFNTESRSFNPSRDLLVLCTGKIANEVFEAWHLLLRESLAAGTERILGRLRQPTDSDGGSQSSETERNIFQSLRCPATLCARGKSDEAATVELIRRIRVLHFDYEDEPSRDYARAISDCQRSLQSGDAEEAKQLWDCLTAIAARNRGRGGSIDLAGLLAELRSSFKLVDHADYRADWQTLNRLSADVLDDIRTDVGGVASLDRPAELQQLWNSLEKSKICLAVGESGCGKSSLAKILGEKKCATTVALPPDVFELARQDQFARAIGIDHPLADVLAASRESCLLVLDSLEKVADDGLRLVGRIVADLRASDRCAHVRILITAQVEGARRVVDRLNDADVDRAQLSLVSIDLPTEDAVRDLVRDVKGVPWATLHHDIRPLLRNLKILDWVVRAAGQSGFSNSQITGLIPLIDYLWDRWVEVDGSGIAQAGLLKRLAVLEASRLDSGIPMMELEHTELQSLPPMLQADLLRRRNERIRFSHDLLGDWARLKVLQGEDPTASDGGLARGAAPRWHRAVRLFGRWLLSRPDGVRLWTEALDRAEDGTSEGRVTCDLLLEAMCVSENAHALMVDAWRVLIANQGKRLKRLLDRFLFVATLPDLELLKESASRQPTPQMEAAFRIPRFAYWGAVIRVLDERVQDVFSIAPIEVARICSLWLGVTPVTVKSGAPFPWRSHAARLAVTVARELQARQAEGRHAGKGDDRIAYEAALLSAQEFPDEVSQFVLEMAERRALSPEIERRAESARRAAAERAAARAAEDPEREARIQMLGESPLMQGELRAPWQDGPFHHVHGEFAEAILNSSALADLAAVRPDAALEVLLAVCIEPPVREDPFGGSDLDESYGVVSWSEFDPPMYFRGPFLELIRTSPAHGIDFVMRLVNFAAEQWLEAEARLRSRRMFPLPSFLEEDTELSVRVQVGSNVATLIGDRRVFRWHLDWPLHCKIVACALMALEKWLYEQLDAGAEIEPHLERLMKGNKSVALAGLLIDIGKRKPRYFETTLRPLLGVSSFYIWEPRILVERANGSLGLMGWWNQPRRLKELAGEWHGFPHRRVELSRMAAWLMLNSSEMESFFAETRQRWLPLLGDQGESSVLRVLIELLDRSNYKETPLDGQKVQITFVPPEALVRQATEKTSSAEQSSRLATFPMECRRTLDADKQIPADNLPAFWESLQTIASLSPSEPSEVSSQAAAICGGIAVLVKLHREWLTSQQMIWCLNWFRQIANDPPERDNFDMPGSSEWTWDSFAGEIAVCLLKEAPDNEGLRYRVALGVVGFHHTATRGTMRVSHQFRESLGALFESMQHLAIRWAMLRMLAERSSAYANEIRRVNATGETVASVQSQSSTVEQELIRQAEHWYDATDEVIRQFVEDSVPRITFREASELGASESEKLDAIRFPARQPGARRSQQQSWYRSRRNIRRKDLGLDPHVIQAAFGWLNLSSASSETERRAVISHVQNLLELVLNSLGESVGGDGDDDDEIDGGPNEFDAWVFGLVAITVVQMDEDKQASSLWQPIMTLGPHAHEWTEHFYWAWFTEGVNAASTPEKFADRWQEMVEFALSSPIWDPHGSHARDLDDMVFELLGFHPGLNDIAAHNRFAPILERMIPVLERAAQRWFLMPKVANGFAHFLRAPACDRLLCPGIKWLRRAAQVTSEYSFWHEHEIESNLIAALSRCWDRYAQIVGADPDLQSAFSWFITTLASRGSHEAMVLRDRVLDSFQ